MLTLRVANGDSVSTVLGPRCSGCWDDGTQVQDTSPKRPPVTFQQRQKVPVLAQVPKFADLFQPRTNTKLHTPGTCTSGFVKVAGRYPVLVPPNSVTKTAVSGTACGPNALVESKRTNTRKPPGSDYSGQCLQDIFLHYNGKPYLKRNLA